MLEDCTSSTGAPFLTFVKYTPVFKSWPNRFLFKQASIITSELSEYSVFLLVLKRTVFGILIITLFVSLRVVE